MKKRNLISALVLTLTLLCGITIGAGASTTLKEIKAYISSGITVNINGQAQMLTDANGKRIYPIVYNGTTYLPVRAVAGLTGFNVGWNQATQTVDLDNPSAGGVDLIDTFKYYYYYGGVGQRQTIDKKNVTISGINTSHWLWLEIANVCIPGDIAEMAFNLEGKYDTISFKYYCDKDVLLRVLGDNNNVLEEISIKGGQVAQTIEVNLFKTTQLTFQIEKTTPRGSGSGNAYIFDTKLK